MIKLTRTFIIFVTDDNSKDKFSLEKLNINERNKKKIIVGFRNKNIGYAQNFLNALVSIDGYFDYYAFSDQDDIWHREKLEKAINSLEGISSIIKQIFMVQELNSLENLRNKAWEIN